MSEHERTLSVIRDIYAAAADERRWPSVLEHLADDYGGGVAGFHYRTGLEGRVRTATFVRIDPAVLEEIRTYYATRNPWVQVTQPLYRVTDVIATDHVLPFSELRRTEYYDGVLRRVGVCHAIGACVFRHGDDIQWAGAARADDWRG